MIKLIIFDWDDVFTLGAKEGYFRCYRETLAEVGVFLDPKVEKERILSKWGQPFREELRALLKEHPELLDSACEIFEKEKFLKNTFINSLKLQKGVNKLLDKLKSKYILAVATGNQVNMIKRIMKKFRIPNVFVQIVTSHDIGDPEKTKPHPFMLEQIMKSQKVKPDETIFVGDAKSDVQMARNAGVEPVVVLTGHLTKDEAKKLGVKYIISDVTDIEEDVLNKMNADISL